MPFEVASTPTQTGMSVPEIVAILADDMGYDPNNSRFRNSIVRAIQQAILEITLKDPQNRRTMVHDAEVNLIAGQATYDVRDTEANGGWGLSNCREVLAAVASSFSDLPLEVVGVEKWRNRAQSTSLEGPPHALVLVDSWRVRIDPVPDSAYTMRVDYLQNYPKLTDGRVSWPEAWDKILIEGVKYEAYKTEYKEFPALWEMQRKIFHELINEMREGEQTTAERPRRAIVTRAIRSRREIPHDNSTDIRLGRYR